MPTLLWKFKSRIQTILHTSSVFRDLLPGVLNSLNNDVFFVEIGANDGINNDPLYPYIIKNNWSGVYVEPQKEVFERLKKNLSENKNVHFENIAITEKEEEVTLYIPQGSGDFDHSVFASLSLDGATQGWHDPDKIKKEIVQGKPLAYLVEKYALGQRPCVFLLLDIEGHERTIISAIDFKTFAPAYILFEHLHMSHREHREVNQFLLQKGYKVYVGHNDTLAHRP